MLYIKGTIMKAFIFFIVIFMLMGNVGHAQQKTKQDTLVLNVPPEDPQAPKGPPPGNPFVKGNEGNWRVKRSWLLQRQRAQTRLGSNDNVNVRTDGTYTNFDAFWSPVSNGVNAAWTKDDSKWEFKLQVNFYNPFGTFELESVDPLNRFSASLYGYNNTLPIAVSMNSRYREIGFDGFEDYMYTKCANEHFSFHRFEGIENKLTDKDSHTGRYSVAVAPNEVVYMYKEFAVCTPETTPTTVPK